jgi:uncharacterized repeat protein (TIGR01451 family)
MRTLKRAGASLLALGVVAASMVMTATVASAHTTDLSASSVCQSDGTYKVTYSGLTHATSGATGYLTATVVAPAGTSLNGAPAKVFGDSAYGFTQIVPGTATGAGAHVKLVWPAHNVTYEKSASIMLGGNCKPPAPTCVSQINNNQLSAHYTTDDFHASVSYTGQTLCAGVSKVVSLNSYQTDGPTWPTSGTQKFVDHAQVTIDKDHTSGYLAVAAPSCFYQTDLYYGSTRFDGHDGALPHYPNSNVPTNLIAARNGGKACVQQKAPSGDLTTSCVNGGGHVATANLDNGTATNVSWRLVSGTDGTHTTVVAGPAATGPLSANNLADGTKVWLQVNTGNGFRDEGSVVTTGKCSPTPVAPSGDLSTSCVNGGGQVVTANLDNGTATNVSWRLVSGTDGTHTTVVAGPAASGPLTANGLADGTKVWLQVKTGGDYTDEGSVVTTGKCSPTPVAPSGDLSTSCVNGGGHVATAALDNGTATNVSWRLVSGTDGTHTTVVAGPAASGPLTANGLADGTKVWLQVNTGNGFSDEGSVVTVGNCAPPVVNPSGSFTVVCSAAGANVTLGTLGSGTRSDVAWTLTFGSDSKTVSSGNVVAVPALASLALKYTVGGGDSHTVQSATAPAACVLPTGNRSLDIVKSVSPTGNAAFGDTLTYTLKVTAGGTLGQTKVLVSDYIPGHKPGRDSGAATYVPGSAACDAGTCDAAFDSSKELVSWGLGDMAAGTTRTVTFKVKIDSPVATANGGIAATTIFNSAAVGSTETSTKPSNEVQTPVTAVLGVKVGKPASGNAPPVVLGTVLPHTGAPAHLPWTLGAAALFLLLGSALIFIARKPEVVRAR